MRNSELVALRKKIKQSRRYKRLRDVLDDKDIEQYSIPVDSYLEEAKSRFVARKYRRLDSNSVNILGDLTAAQIEDANLRSRLTEMLIVCEQAKKSINSLLDRFVAFALVEYSGDMRHVISTKDERKQFLLAILNDYYKYLQEVEVLSEQIKLLITDIDKAGYATKNIIEAQRLIYRPEMRS